ncbi:MAG: ThiF family adenylyltransferase [Candidatus Eremiobacteraeota bacterium]|nr:ThiF family adenylyltransferase [Candidatus Eremiobacteraeota bacterium]
MKDIDTAEERPPGALKEQRYQRHSLIDWFDQEQVKRARVVVVGAGATGNEVLKNLALLGTGHIHVIDFDRIETHNLTRSVLFKEEDTGRFKAEAAAEACRAIDPKVYTTFETGDLWETLRIGDMKSYDALFCCVDNYEARIRLNELCLWARVDLYNTAIDSRYVCIEQYPFSRDRGCACYQCNLPPSAYAKIRERYSCGWLRKKAYEEKKIPTTAITASLAGSILCSLFLQRNHPGGPQGAVRLYFDTISLNSTVTHLSHQEECFCSSIFHDSHYFKVKNVPGADYARLLGSEESLVLSLSDKLVLDVTCRNCGLSRAIDDNVRRFDESLALCGACRTHSNDITIKDIITLDELSMRFSRKAVPVKFMHFTRDDTQILLEMEE